MLVQAIRRCFAPRDVQAGSMIRCVPLMDQYSAGEGVYMDSETAWGMHAKQALHEYVEEREETYERGEWYEGTGGTIDLNSGGMPLGHSYTKSMFTEGVKWYGRDGLLLNNY